MGKESDVTNWFGVPRSYYKLLPYMGKLLPYMGNVSVTAIQIWGPEIILQLLLPISFTIYIHIMQHIPRISKREFHSNSNLGFRDHITVIIAHIQ